MAVLLIKDDHSKHYLRKTKFDSQPVEKTENTLVIQYALHDFTRTVVGTLAEATAMQTADAKSTSGKTIDGKRVN